MGRNRAGRSGGSFTLGLVVAVLLAGVVVVVAQAFVAKQLVAAAVRDEAERQTTLDAAVTQQIAGAAGAAAALAPLQARGDITSATLLTGEQATADALANEAVTTGVTRSESRGEDRLRVVAPLTVAGQRAGLELVLDTSGAAGGADAMWRDLVAVLAVGALAMAALTIVLGGRRLAGRHRSVVEDSLTDDLTGLGNRRAFLQRLPAAVRQSQTMGDQLALALLDVNGLAQANDQAGRRHGDQLLERVGSVLAGSGPRGTEVFRLGSSGFAAIMPGASPAKAAQLADAIRSRVHDKAAPLTAVVGLCMLDDRTPDAETMLIGADAALHEAHRATGPTTPASTGGSRVFAGTDLSQVPDRRTDAISDMWDIRLLEEWEAQQRQKAARPDATS